MKWPLNPDVSGKVSPEDPEVKTIVLVNAVQPNERTDAIMHFINHFSSWVQLKRMVGWLLRFKSLLRDLAQLRKHFKAVLAQSGLDKVQLERRLQEEMQNVKAQAARGSLSVEEFDDAEMAIVRFCQKKRFRRRYPVCRQEKA